MKADDSHKKVPFTVRTTETTAKNLAKVATARGSDRAAVSAMILECARELTPENFLHALAQFEKASKAG